jgi:hypothetical protein
MWRKNILRRPTAEIFWVHRERRSLDAWFYFINLISVLIQTVLGRKSFSLNFSTFIHENSRFFFKLLSKFYEHGILLRNFLATIFLPRPLTSFSEKLAHQLGHTHNLTFYIFFSRRIFTQLCPSTPYFGPTSLQE